MLCKSEKTKKKLLDGGGEGGIIPISLLNFAMFLPIVKKWALNRKEIYTGNIHFHKPFYILCS